MGSRKKKKKTGMKNSTETSNPGLNMHDKHTRHAHFKIKQMSYFKCFIAKLKDCSYYYLKKLLESHFSILCTSKSLALMFCSSDLDLIMNIYAT